MKKRHPIPPLRRYRRAALTELLLILALSALAAVIIARRMDKPMEIRVDRLLEPTEQVHILTMAPETYDDRDAAEEWVRYPAPLEDELQRYIWGLCGERGTDPALVYAIMAVETGGTWDPALVGDGGESVGLMQIYAGYHRERMARLGVFDLTDPYQCAAVGIDILAELSRTEKPEEWVVMAYNGGAAYADRMTESGTVSEYARRVMELAESYDEAAVIVR